MYLLHPKKYQKPSRVFPLKIELYITVKGIPDQGCDRALSH